jgi:GTPase
MSNTDDFKSGFVSILGKPNVGKSTLTNSFLKQKLSIVSKKPQTTRKKILGIYNDDKSQIIFIDTPGILEPEYLLQKKMYDSIISSMNESDILLFLVDVQQYDISELKRYENIFNIISTSKIPKILVVNKIDLLENKNEVLKIIEITNKTKMFNDIFPVSALQTENVEELLTCIKNYLPIHPPYFDSDSVSDVPIRFFISEIIREKIFERYRDEIPYSTEVVIDEYKERKNAKDYISASIIVERDTQRKIIIGKDGESLKKIGELARKEIETFIEKEVYLKTFVKVKEKWRNNEKTLKSFGY